MEIEVSEKMKAALSTYTSWDLDEIKTILPTIFPNAKCIQIVGCDYHYVTIGVDDKRYLLNVEGQVWR
jgi:hypothetical protein